MKLLVISRDCFSQSNANGKTLEALLSAFKKDELMQFYTGEDAPDIDFCSNYFCVTDRQMIKSFWTTPVVDVKKTEGPETRYKARLEAHMSKSWDFIKKYKYNYIVRYLREVLWRISPKWERDFNKWIDGGEPSAILYMVGDSFFLDQMVMEISARKRIPIILFNVEAYRIIDCKERSGFDRMYNTKAERTYNKLQHKSALTIYNCKPLRESFQKFYALKKENAHIAYNSYCFDVPEYSPQVGRCRIVYFGNLGLGRVGSLLDVANVTQEIDPNLKIDVYGKASESEIQKLRNHRGICYHGMVGQDILSKVKQEGDVLLQVESFEPSIMKKLRYAFSTKIAQCLCAGRALLCYAPISIASTEYLQEMDAAVIADSIDSLKTKLILLITNVQYRANYAEKALRVAKANHDSVIIGNNIREHIVKIL